VVRSNVCPNCLDELGSSYVEEGDLVIFDEEVICPHCGYIFKGALEYHKEEDGTDQRIKKDGAQDGS